MEINYEIAFWSFFVFHIVVNIINLKLSKKKEDLYKKTANLLDKSIKARQDGIKLTEKTMEKYKIAISREAYLLKTMNDAMKVTEPKGFMAQRMRNAPKEFEPRKEKDIKPDKIN